MKYPQARLLLFSKAPDAGKVKTRLIPLLGSTAAAELYTHLLHKTLTLCSRAELCPVELWCSPSIEHPFFQTCQQAYNTDLHPQSQGDLGQRMSEAIRASLQHAEMVIVLGADCPELACSDLETALNALQTGIEVVIGPAQDGGYYLIGLRKYTPALFTSITWGTHNVLDDTLTRIHSLGLSLRQLRLLNDLDTPEDYAEFKRLELIP